MKHESSYTHKLEVMNKVKVFKNFQKNYLQGQGPRFKNVDFQNDSVTRNTQIKHQALALALTV